MRILPYGLSAAACMLALTPAPIRAESADDGTAYHAHATAVYVATNAATGNDRRVPSGEKRLAVKLCDVSDGRRRCRAEQGSSAYPQCGRSVGFERKHPICSGSGTISSYDQRLDGTLSLTVAVAPPIVPMSGPIDLGLSRDGAFLYQLYGALGKIGIYKTGPSGSLSYVGIVGGLPVTGTQGIVVY